MQSKRPDLLQSVFVSSPRFGRTALQQDQALSPGANALQSVNDLAAQSCNFRFGTLDLFEWDLDLRRALEPGRHWQILRAQELRVEQLGLVTRTEIAQHGDDG